jgi:glycolate oxidase FAD binding subunit
LKSFGEITVLEEAASRDALEIGPRRRSVRARRPRALAHLDGADARAWVAAAIGPGAFLYDWAGGLIWAALPAADDGGAARVRAAVGDGHATLVRAPAATRAAVPVFEPQDPGLAALTRRVKESFDPKGVLGPGRMYAGV